MNNLTKLTKNNGWKDIADAPRGGAVVFQDRLIAVSNPNDPPKWMPLDTPERMAKVIQVLVVEVVRVKEAAAMQVAVPIRVNDLLELKCVVDDLSEALEKANKIAAEGEGR
jgi:predicted secreted protein